MTTRRSQDINAFVAVLEERLSQEMRHVHERMDHDAIERSLAQAEVKAEFKTLNINLADLNERERERNGQFAMLVTRANDEARWREEHENVDNDREKRLSALISDKHDNEVRRMTWKQIAAVLGTGVLIGGGILEAAQRLGVF